ncbi:SRPBCC family protein [Cohnella sp. REN36]|uniref:SRPBCC family protein n=1 Tax=Cohnella sp. REN36 TaxID=2887347 RepID=UPI001D1578D9|nr:SRPBCC family protein [Cohnella sp. REN36]MCC3375180.1 SRPBCC family protein [Cohnella sp. REN36]
MSQAHAPNETNTAIEGPQLKVTRTFNAPRELVYKVWTEPEHLPHWWGPSGFTITTQAIDVKEGGRWRFVMHGPNGADYDNQIRYLEVVRPERIVYAHGDGESEDFRVTVTFAERGQQTDLTMVMTFPSVEALEKTVREVGAIEGAKSTMDRLAAHLAETA